MTAIEALEALRALPKDGASDAVHVKADEILVSFLKDHDPACADVAKAYEEVRKHVGFWYS